MDHEQHAPQLESEPAPNEPGDNVVEKLTESTADNIRNVEGQTEVPVYVYATMDTAGNKIIQITDEDADFQLRFSGELSDEDAAALDSTLHFEGKLTAIEPQSQSQSFNESFGLTESWGNWGDAFMDNRFDYFGQATLRLSEDFTLPPTLEKYLVTDADQEHPIDREFLQDSIEFQKMQE